MPLYEIHKNNYENEQPIQHSESKKLKKKLYMRIYSFDLTTDGNTSDKS
jgi:hypothetical protein